LEKGVAMRQVTIGKWGKCLAIRIPLDIEKSAHLSLGELVEISAFQGNIFIRRPAALAHARAAAEEIIAERKKYTLDNKMIQSFIKEGRRG
jgi:antitoxin MazE